MHEHEPKRINNYLFMDELHKPTFKFHSDCDFPQFSARHGMWTRCNKCLPCLRYKANTWIHRSVKERSKWDRAWFITLTYANTESYDYNNVKKYLKMLRKRIRAKGIRIAYIVTDETDSSRTRDYNPHHHMVVYGPDNLKYRDFDKLWSYGHRKLSLLENRSASYVAKYLTKSGSRVRASQDYGTHTIKHCKIMLNPSLA